MAEEDMRALSPPLPPDPVPAAPRVETLQQPPIGSQQTSPVTPSRAKHEPDLRRVDSIRTSQPAGAVPQVLQPQQPIKDALSDAFGQSPVVNQLDPDFIKQVTEQVIKSLQAAGTTPTVSAPPQYPSPPQRPQEPRSPTQSSVDSNNERYTPPSPDRNREAQDDRGNGSLSPEPHSDSGSNVSRESWESFRSNESRRSQDTPKPFASELSNRVRKSGYSTRRRSGTIPQESSGREGSGSDTTARESSRYRRESKESEMSYDGTSRSRPRPPRIPSDIAETPLEKFWQPLFDNGNPTMRLSQFLRGLALHLIDDYEPKGSLVVTPAKMLRFLNETKIEEEHYPWDIIFGDKLSPVSISMMYQKLLCQHHLVQDRYDKAPYVPGLTPMGFDSFMTYVIQAHPETEFERLTKAVIHMPIANADNKTERFPKELPRRLLPAQANIQAQQRLISSLNHEPYVVGTLKDTSWMPPPPPPPASQPTASVNIERERMPYSSTAQHSNVIDDDDLISPPSIPIERERQPYSAREGGGKTYNADDTRPTTSQYKPEAPQGGPRTSRANSGLPPQGVYATSSGPSEPLNIPQRSSYRASMGPGIPPPGMNGGYSKSRPRSPPGVRNPFARSEPEYVGSIPNSQYGSNLHPTNSREQYPVELGDDELRRYPSRSKADRSNTTTTHPNDDDTSGARGYPIPSRGVPISTGYEYGTGGPPLGDPRASIPVGSYPSQRRPMAAGSSDERRRSTYVSPTMGMAGEGGTDGYGSFAGNMNGGSGYPPQGLYGSPAQH